MHISQKRDIVLPDGMTVVISDVPEAWWTQHGASGFINPALLAPDPDQPRKRMREGKLEELYQSIAARGVRQAITVTPRVLAPWITLAHEDEDAFFAIVSGHRRQAGALRAQLQAVPIQIAIYQDENEHRTDAGLLNACRDDLDEAEQGYEFVRLRAAGSSVAAISKAWGMVTQQVYNRINLTKLHPDIQKLLEKDGTSGRRILSVTVGGILGGAPVPSADELERLAISFAGFIDPALVTGHESFDHLDDDARRFAMQKMLVAVMRKRHLSAQQAAEFVRDRTLKFRASIGNDVRTERYQPARRKDVLKNLAKSVSGTPIADWRPDEYRRIFEFASREELDAFIVEMNAACDVFAGVVKILSAIRDAKRATPPEVLRIMEARIRKAANA